VVSKSQSFRFARFSLVSWWDMQQVMLGAFHAVLNLLCVLESRARNKPRPGDPIAATWLGQEAKFDEDEVDSLRIDLQIIATRLDVVGLPASGKLVDRYVKELESIRDRQTGNIVCRMTQLTSEVIPRIQEIHRAIQAESETVLFLSIPNEDSEWYRSPCRDWEAVLGRWLELRTNVEECSKCIALERYGAAVFHVLLIAEFGVIKVSELFGVQGDRPGWGAVERLHKITLKPYKDRSSVEVANFDLLGKLVPLMHSIKTSWRHKLDHVDNQITWLDTDFSPKVAKEIVSATQGFMRILAMELPVTTP
jgi:hypothetical protein